MWLQKRVLCVAQKLNCVTLARAHFRSLGFAGAHICESRQHFCGFIWFTTMLCVLAFWVCDFQQVNDELHKTALTKRMNEQKKTACATCVQSCVIDGKLIHHKQTHNTTPADGRKSCKKRNNNMIPREAFLFKVNRVIGTQKFESSCSDGLKFTVQLIGYKCVSECVHEVYWYWFVCIFLWSRLIEC